MINRILLTDSYKASHYLQYPQETQGVFSYIESRGGLFAETLFFGLQMFLKAYLLTPISMEEVLEAKAIWQAHGLQFNEAGWRYIVEKLKGRLPLHIAAVPEGSIIPTKNVLLSIENTDPACFWLSAYFETILLQAIWYPTTVATLSYELKKILRAFHAKSSELPESSLDFKLHDFGYRGVSSNESAAIGGLAHLVNFKGTDTVAALLQAKRYYQTDMAGFSIPAAEHATITAWGREHEADAYENMLKQFAKPDALLAVVSDSYDIYHAVEKLWGEALKARVEASGATIIIRSDSGVPRKIVVELIERLMQKFGFRLNAKGYRVLPECIRLIHSDGLNFYVIQDILSALDNARLSLDNLAFGMGGALLQQVNRDTQKFAMKCSAVKIKDKWQAVFKDPVTASSKRSKADRLALVKDQDGYQTVAESALGDRQNLLRSVFLNGELCVDESLETIRARVSR